MKRQRGDSMIYLLLLLLIFVVLGMHLASMLVRVWREEFPPARTECILPSSQPPEVEAVASTYSTDT